MTHWYVAQVTSGDERRVCERAMARGMVDPWHHPLLTGYVIAQGHPATLRYTEDVIRVLPFSDQPQPIDHDLVLILQERCRAFDQAVRIKLQDGKEAEIEPLAGMSRQMIGNDFASKGWGVSIAGSRVELDEHPPRSSAPRGARRNHGHDARRAIKLAAGA